PVPALIDIRAQLSAAVNLAFGCDTSGIDLFKESHDPADLFSGFYVLNHAVVNGKDNGVLPQISLNGNLRAGGAVGVDVAGVGVQVGVAGNLSATIGATLHDPDHDGRVYASEFEENVKDGLRCTFDISGQLTTELVFYGEIDFFLGSEGFQIPITPKKVLLDYTASDSDCYPDRFESVTLENLAPGTYYAHVSGTGDEVRYNLAIEPAPDSLTRVYYVNDPHVTDPDQNSYYSLAPGNDGNDGRSPRTPKATLQGLL